MDFRIKKVEINGMKFKLQFWDTSGFGNFYTLTKAFYRGANGIILVCDLSQADSLSNMEELMKEIKNNAEPDVCIILVGSKNDLNNKIPIDVITSFASDNNMPFVSTSAKTGKGVEEAVLRLLKEVIILSKDDFGVTMPPNDNGQFIGQNTAPKKSLCLS